MSEIRYITVPAPVDLTLDHPQTGQSVSASREFYQLVRERTADSKAFGAGREGSTAIDRLMLGMAIRQAFAGCKPGDVIGITREQWDALCDSLRNPEAPYFPEVMMQIIAHVKAILDAPTTRPVPTTVAAESADLPVAAE